MKVLMTGADGFIGSNILQYFLNNTKWEFTIICSFRHMGSPFNVPLSNRVKVVTMDLKGTIPDLGKFDYIMHLASESHVDRSITDPLNFVENNVSITLQILEYARKHVPKRFLLFSTDEVYGAREHQDWDILLPTNPYAASKACQEMIAISYYNTYKLPIIITNANNIVGKNQHPEKFVPKIIKSLKEGKPITIHTSNGRLGKRFYNPVDNIASAIIFIMRLKHEPRELHGIFSDYDAFETGPPRYALVGGEVKDNLEIAKLVAKILGIPLKYKLIDVKSVRPAYDNFYDEGEPKLKTMGWTPPVTLEEGLQWIKSL